MRRRETRDVGEKRHVVDGGEVENARKEEEKENTH